MAFRSNTDSASASFLPAFSNALRCLWFVRLFDIGYLTRNRGLHQTKD